VTRCTVEPLAGDGDEVFVQLPGGLEQAPAAFAAGVSKHLDRLRRELETTERFRIETFNTFPMGAGLASSASGFAALALGVTGALGLEPGAEQLSHLARLSGSGSAARSVLGGFVEWPGDAADPASPARQIAAADHWPLADVVAVVDSSPKEVSSLDGHRAAPSSPHFERRLELLPDRMERTRRAIRDRDFTTLTEVLEEEAIELHLIAMSSRPAIFYWTPATLRVLAVVRFLRASGVPAAYTIDAGPNVHVICPVAVEAEVARALAAVEGVDRVIRDRVGEGPYLVRESGNGEGSRR
jgi:diphosphomevalonate decarboxylase